MTNTRKEKDTWYSTDKKGQRIKIIGDPGNRYQKCVNEGEDFCIFESEDRVTEIKKYTIFGIENGFVKEKGDFKGRIDGFIEVKDNIIAVKEWDGGNWNCYKQYYGLDGKRLERGEFLYPREERREWEQAKEANQTTPTDVVNTASNVERIERVVTDTISTGFLTKRSKNVAYSLCIGLGWILWLHHLYLSRNKLIALKKNDKLKVIDWGQELRTIPTLLGTLTAGIGFYKLFHGGNDLNLCILGLCVNIAYWIFDLITLGKQVDQWNSKYASY